MKGLGPPTFKLDSAGPPSRACTCVYARIKGSRCHRVTRWEMQSISPCHGYRGRRPRLLSREPTLGRSLGGPAPLQCMERSGILCRQGWPIQAEAILITCWRPRGPSRPEREHLGMCTIGHRRRAQAEAEGRSDAQPEVALAVSYNITSTSANSNTTNANTNGRHHFKTTTWVARRPKPTPQPATKRFSQVGAALAKVACHRAVSYIGSQIGK